MLAAAVAEMSSGLRKGTAHHAALCMHASSSRKHCNVQVHELQPYAATGSSTSKMMSGDLCAITKAYLTLALVVVGV
jgi:hypothetical protein